MGQVKTMRLVAFIVTLTLAVSMGVSAGLAQDATPTPAPPEDILAFEIYPKGGIFGDFFSPRIEPGKSVTLTAFIACTGTIPFEGRTFAINAFTAINGGFAIAESGTPPAEVTTWLDYPEGVYTIQPGTGIELPFTVTVPEGTPPGQYLTAIAVENAEAREVEGSENFLQITRFPVPVFITVPGPVEPGFEIGDVTLTVEPNASLLDVEIRNTGNVRLRPEGLVTLADGEGRELFNAPVTMSSVYAHDKTSLQINIPQGLAEGEYQISVDLKDPETKVVAATEVTVTAAGPATPPPPPPVQVAGTIAPKPDADDVQFLDVNALITNGGEDLTNIQVVLHVTKDGETVEDFPIASAMAVPQGDTLVQSRYIPATGWSEGVWHFALTVQAVDPGTGVAQVLATADLGDVTVS